MEQKKIEAYWHRFYRSGSVNAYLAYKQAVSEEQGDELFHQRIDHPGAARGGSGSIGDRSHS